MQTISTPANAQAWRDVYVSALFESDTGKLPQRIAEAEWALTRRRRELYQATGNNIEEEEALDDAYVFSECLEERVSMRAGSGAVPCRGGLTANKHGQQIFVVAPSFFHRNS